MTPAAEKAIRTAALRLSGEGLRMHKESMVLWETVRAIRARAGKAQDVEAAMALDDAATVLVNFAAERGSTSGRWNDAALAFFAALRREVA